MPNMVTPDEAANLRLKCLEIARQRLGSKPVEAQLELAKSYADFVLGTK